MNKNKAKVDGNEFPIEGAQMRPCLCQRQQQIAIPQAHN